MDGTLTVTPATLTVTADNQTKTYGAANPTLTHTTTGFVNGDDETDLVGTITCLDAGGRDVGRLGLYAITCSGATSTNYTISYVAGTLTVTAATLTVTAARPDEGVRGGEPDADAHDDRVRERRRRGRPHRRRSPARRRRMRRRRWAAYPITCGGATSTNYTISYVDGTLTVTTATLTVTADDQTKSYGAANPTLTHTTTGFVNGDDETDLAGLIIVHDGGRRDVGGRDLPDHVCGCDEHQLHDQLRGRDLDDHDGDPHGDRRQPDQDLRGGEPDAYPHARLGS